MIRLNVGTSDKSTHSKGSWDENSPTEIKRGDSTSSLGLSNHGSKHGSAHGNHLSTPRALYRALSSRYHKSQTDLTALTEIGIREITPSITVKSTQILDITKFPIVASNYSSELKLDHFTNIAHLCYGSHSEIATCHYDNKSVIVKVISQEHHDSSIAMQEFQREVNILSRLNHPHIVGIIGTGIVTKPGLSIQSPLIALEYLEGNTLKHHLSIRRPFHSRPFTELRYLRMAREFADALVYLHQGFSSECTLIHRDLKPDNLGFTPAGLLKILDFGLCIPLKKDTSDSGTYTLTGCTGSLRYMAPEVALNKPYNEKVDMYSFGIILYEMITGVAPFKGLKRNEFYARVVNGKKRPAFDYDDYGREVFMHRRIQQLIIDCWDDSMDQRPSAFEAFNIVKEVEEEVSQSQLKQSFLVKSFSFMITKRDSI